MKTWKVKWKYQTTRGFYREDSAHFVSKESAENFVKEQLKLVRLRGDVIIEESTM